MLRIPNLTQDDYFKLEDFQNDFSYLNQFNLDIASSIKIINDWKSTTSFTINNFEKSYTEDISSLRSTTSLNYTNLLNLLASISQSAQRYGINGDEYADDTDKIQEFIALRGNLYFPKGTYNLSKMINIYGNTTITLHPEAIFIRKHAGVMFQTATTTETLGYGGEKNIRINGGTYKHNGSLNPSNIFSVFHADDVVFNDVVFLDTVGAHSIDIVGSNDVKVLHCKFKGYVKYEEQPAKEAIQIDAAGCNSYPIYSKEVNAYDGTPSCNVTVANCVFCKSENYPSYPTAVGQHGQPKLNGSRYKNIKILNNLMIGDPNWTYSQGIRPMSWENSLIQGNIIENYNTAIFIDLYSSIIDSHGDSIKGETNHVTALDEDLYYIGCKDITISNNILKSASSVNLRPGVWVNIAGTTLTASEANSPKHRGISVTDNTIYMPSAGIKSYGIDLDTVEDGIIRGNTFINNAKSDSIAIGCQDYCKNIIISDNAYKNITEANEVYIKSNTEKVKKKGRTILWEGQWYNGKNQANGTAAASGDIITLSDNISNYDHIIVDFTYSGFESRILDFTYGNTQTVRTLNLSDAGNSTVWGVNEFVIQKKTETTLELLVNKMQNMSNNAITMNQSALYISKIAGVNY